jgi:hypothetical protein
MHSLLLLLRRSVHALPPSRAHVQAHHRDRSGTARPPMRAHACTTGLRAQRTQTTVCAGQCHPIAGQCHPANRSARVTFSTDYRVRGPVPLHCGPVPPHCGPVPPRQQVCARDLQLADYRVRGPVPPRQRRIYARTRSHARGVMHARARAQARVPQVEVRTRPKWDDTA